MNIDLVLTLLIVLPELRQPALWAGALSFLDALFTRGLEALAR